MLAYSANTNPHICLSTRTVRQKYCQLPVHADGNAIVKQQPREAAPGRISALVGIEDFQQSAPNPAYIVFDNRQPSTLRLYHSIMINKKQNHATTGCR